MSDIGFNSIQPQIGRISFRKAGFMTLNLADGRQVYVPLDRFPGIARLTPNQRRRYHVADGTVILFHDDENAYHIQDFLGTYETNAYRSPGKQQLPDLTQA